MTAPLPRTYSVEEVADALGVPERYLREKCRRREWPHKRGSRGTPRFSQADVLEIQELMSVPVSETAAPRFALAPRSRRRAS